MGRGRWIFAAVVALGLAAPVGAHAATATPPAVAFGDVRVGLSPTQTVTVTRNVLDVSFGPVAVTGPGFAATGCSPAPAPGSDCTLSVTFTPATRGPATGT